MKQYNVLIQFKKDEWCDSWVNAVTLADGLKRRYVNTHGEALEVLHRVLERFNGEAGIEYKSCNGLGVELVVDEKTAEDLSIVKAKIRVREVSKWVEI